MDFAKRILQSALDCGYDNCGIIAPEDLIDSAEYLKERMERVPESAMAYNGIADDFSPVKERFPWAKSVVVSTFEHGKYRYPPEMRKRYAKAFFLSPEDGHTDAIFGIIQHWLTAGRRVPPEEMAKVVMQLRFPV